ncbi:NUDIX domain-containing protein [Paenisporosarcina indica]|uniref:NUDIX domain-containing protein n=1 Tax=Paenisporosarcina indica TaxID=650093 RepID=UPI000950303F|nr:NUDIX domain-containing protein [Paenisporosarcina indica]
MFSFTDLNGIKVTLSFEKNAILIPSKHILVLANNEDKWLLTKHPKRGVEFPGGKVEDYETLEKAALRETYEETGVRISNVEWLAEYIVHDLKPFCKTVFRAKVDDIEEGFEKHETEGPIWFTLQEFFLSKDLSFHMKDEGMRKIMERVISDETRWHNRTETSLS